MDLLHEPPHGFEGVARAFEMARHLPTTHRMNLQVGLVHDGELFATAQLDGYRQVRFFSEHLRHLGWREHLLGGDDEMFGCDLLFSDPEPSEAQQDQDPSFIRRTPVQLWGAHAGEHSS